MKRILHLILISCLCLSAAAQKNAPKWMNKAKRAVFTITTYGKDGNKLATSTGFFISETGEAVSAYNIFKGAEKATITDFEGKTFLIKNILGADELYDAVKFQVEVPKKAVFLPIAAEPVANGTNAYLLLYSTGKNATFKSGVITEVSKLKDPYKYYKMAVALEENELNAPLLTPEGEVFGLAQADAGGKKDICYGLSAGYAGSLSIGSADYLSSAYRNINIPKGWPKELDQATVALYLISGTQDAKARLETVNDFITTFPDAPDGYLNRSDLYAYNRAELANSMAEQATYLQKALDDIKTASKCSDKKGDFWYNQAKLIYGVASADSTLTDPAWTIEAAMEALDKAIEEDNLPAYHQLRADILFNKGEFQQAFDEYMIVNNSDVASASSYYLAAKAKERVTGFNIGDVIDLYNRAELANSMAEQATYLQKALDDIKTASKCSDKKGDFWYNQAKLIYGVASADSTLTDPAWTIEAAMEALDKAIEEDNLPAYHQLRADILFNKGEFQQAFDEYMIVNNSDVASASSYYLAAKAKERVTGFNIGDVIDLLDKAIEKCGTNMNAEAAAYVLERINWRLRLAQYTEAIADYDLYYTLIGGQVLPNFFFLREQAKFRAGDLEGALKDIQAAIQGSPSTPDYYAEEASIYVRQQKYEDALKSIERAIAIAPDFGACYRLRGVCYVRLKKKTEACEAFNKAKELGDPLAGKLIKEHCK